MRALNARHVFGNVALVASPSETKKEARLNGPAGLQLDDRDVATLATPASILLKRHAGHLIPPDPTPSNSSPNEALPEYSHYGNRWGNRRTSVRPCVSLFVRARGYKRLNAPRRALSSRTPTSRCRSATAGRRVRARESPPGAGRAATGTRVALRSRPLLPARQHVRP